MTLEHFFRRRPHGDAAFLGGFLRGAGQEAAEGFARERVALPGGENPLRDGIVQDFGQDAVGGHDAPRPAA